MHAALVELDAAVGDRARAGRVITLFERPAHARILRAGGGGRIGGPPRRLVDGAIAAHITGSAAHLAGKSRIDRLIGAAHRRLRSAGTIVPLGELGTHARLVKLDAMIVTGAAM